jgi:hypothetical protein
MELADKLAHLVRGGIPSGLGRMAASGRARVRQYAPVIRTHRSVIGAVSFCLAMLLGGFAVAMGGGSAVRAADRDGSAHHTSLADGRRDDPGNASLRQFGATSSLALAPATAAPTAAPATLTDEPPLATREDFGFAPYWTLAQSPTFDITGLSTLAYFSIDVNGNGTLDESGPGWNGFQSQDLAELISRAHAAGERVVLKVTDFGQSSLDALTRVTAGDA